MDYNPELVGELYHALDAAPPFALIPVLSVALKGSFEARAVDLLLADYAEKSLTFVESKGHDERAPVPVDGSVPGRCYIGQCPTGEPTPSGWTTYLPVTVRSERLGALAIVLPAEPDAGALRVLAQVASAVAHVLITASRYTDVFERVRRRRDLVLAAELQWELLPVLGYECEQFSLAGTLEPAYEVGGDNFDYAVEEDRLTLCVTDGMGHGLRSAMLTVLVVAAMRNRRRASGTILDQITFANQAICDQYGGDQFVTSLVISLDLATGAGVAINAGHPQAWLQRGKNIDGLSLAPDIPLGLDQNTVYHEQPVQILPGDRLVLLSDGVLEARPDRGDPFGSDRFAAILERTRHETPLEVVRSVLAQIVEYCTGPLRDDATLLCLDWAGDADEPL